MLSIDVQNNIAEALKKINVLSDKQLPAIVAHAINKTMVTVRAKERAKMNEVFSRPTPYTLRALYTTPATQDRLETSIALRQFGGKGVPAERFLGPEIEGGRRTYKAHEKALAAMGILPQGMYCVPSSHAGTYGYLDQYGNIPGSLINRILSALGANRDTTQNSKSKSKKAQFFAISKSGTLPLGIYQRTGAQVRMVMAFVKPPEYSKRFDYFGTAQQTVDRFLLSDLKQLTDQAVEKASTDIGSAFAESLVQALT